MNNLDKLKSLQFEIDNYKSKIDQKEYEKKDIIISYFKDLVKNTKWTCKIKPFYPKLIPKDLSVFDKLEKYVGLDEHDNFRIHFDGDNDLSSKIVLKWSEDEEDGKFLELQNYSLIQKIIDDFQIIVYFDTSHLENNISELEKSLSEDKEILKFAREYNHVNCN
jgi:hypothetical protein